MRKGRKEREALRLVDGGKLHTARKEAAERLRIIRANTGISHTKGPKLPIAGIYEAKGEEGTIRDWSLRTEDVVPRKKAPRKRGSNLMQSALADLKQHQSLLKWRAKRDAERLIENPDYVEPEAIDPEDREY